MIYLDSAATTLQKPLSVARAVSRAIDNMATPGRGGHSAAALAAHTAFACREEAAALFHVPDPEQVIFTFNATHGLNIAIQSLVKANSRVIISGFEHNAVTRPLQAIDPREVRVVRSPLFEPNQMIAAIKQELEQGADVVICTHVSNVFGYILPINEIASLCRQSNVPLIIDASQSAGAVPLDFETLGAAFIAMPGHKGLYGPQGTGLLLCGAHPEPLFFGGTGSESIQQTMPAFLPDRLEAGTHNIAGIAGLLEGLRYVRQRGVSAIAAQEQHLIDILTGLSNLPGVEVFQSQCREDQAGVISFRIPGMDCEDVGEQLSRCGFAVRAGLHCAPLAHQTAGTLETGTIRASVSAFNREVEMIQFIHAVSALSRHN